MKHEQLEFNLNESGVLVAPVFHTLLNMLKNSLDSVIRFSNLDLFEYVQLATCTAIESDENFHKLPEDEKNQLIQLMNISFNDYYVLVVGKEPTSIDGFSLSEIKSAPTPVKGEKELKIEQAVAYSNKKHKSTNVSTNTNTKNHLKLVK